MCSLCISKDMSAINERHNPRNFKTLLRALSFVGDFAADPVGPLLKKVPRYSCYFTGHVAYIIDCSYFVLALKYLYT